MRIVLPTNKAGTADRLVPRREVMDVLNIQSHARINRLVERGELPKPVEVGYAKQFRLSELAEKFPGVFVVQP